MKEWWSELNRSYSIEMLGFILALGITVAMTQVTIKLVLARWMIGVWLIWGMWALIAFLSYMAYVLSKECRKLEALAYSRPRKAESSSSSD
jgi:hypothetical protein